MPRRLQNVMFFIAALLGAGGIFFRYALNMSFVNEVNWQSLAIQMLQVCNFNFVILPLMLVPKFEWARQYSVYFSMFAAATTMFSIPASYSGLEWYDASLMNFWFNHFFAIALPVWMLASKRLAPKRKYIPFVTGAVFSYFTLVFVITEWLMKIGVLAPGSSFSYVHDPKGMPVITELYELIGGPYVHLLPLLLVLVVFFWLWSIPFRNKDN